MASKTNPPRYQIIAATLRDELAAGRYPLGSIFPKEIDLCQRFGVSRFTVRNAIRELENEALLVRHKARGTTVINLTAPQAYVQTLNHLDEMLTYPPETTLTPRYTKSIKADAQLARWFDVDLNDALVNIGGVRFSADGHARLCWTDVYVRPEHRDVANHIGREPFPVYQLLEQQFDLSAADVELNIGATALDASTAAELEVAVGTPALLVERRYFDKSGRVFEVSVTRHPESRYTYALRFERRSQGETHSRAQQTTRSNQSALQE